MHLVIINGRILKNIQIDRNYVPSHHCSAPKSTLQSSICLHQCLLHILYNGTVQFKYDMHTKSTLQSSFYLNAYTDIRIHTCTHTMSAVSLPY